MEQATPKNTCCTGTVGLQGGWTYDCPQMNRKTTTSSRPWVLISKDTLIKFHSATCCCTVLITWFRQWKRKRSFLFTYFHTVCSPCWPFVDVAGELFVSMMSVINLNCKYMLCNNVSLCTAFKTYNTQCNTMHYSWYNWFCIAKEETHIMLLKYPVLLFTDWFVPIYDSVLSCMAYTVSKMTITFWRVFCVCVRHAVNAGCIYWILALDCRRNSVYTSVCYLSSELFNQRLICTFQNISLEECIDTFRY